MELLSRLLPKKPSEQKDRIHFLDELRGFAVFCMVFYHGFYVFSELFRFEWSTSLLRFFQPLEPVYAAGFLVLSGIASNLSRSNLIRGVKLGVIAAAITVITVFVTPEQPIYFGILHLMSLAMILTGLLMNVFRKLPAWPSAAFCAAAAVFTYGVSDRFLGFFSVPLIPLPDALYQTDWLSFLGFYSSSYFSADYFPVLPWLFVFFAGVFFGRFAAEGRFPGWTYKKHVPFFAFIGRHALLIYLAHLPLFYGTGLLVSSLLS